MWKMHIQTTTRLHFTPSRLTDVCSFEWLPFRALGEVVLEKQGTGGPLPLGRLIPDSWFLLGSAGSVSSPKRKWLGPTQVLPNLPSAHSRPLGLPRLLPWNVLMSGPSSQAATCASGCSAWVWSAELGGRREGEGNWGELDQTAPPLHLDRSLSHENLHPKPPHPHHIPKTQRGLREEIGLSTSRKPQLS